jgi:2-succinyl-5-enolpyruvyl-6-hydroxy-3-cyclohexene-1-carboxylate synthase
LLEQSLFELLFGTPHEVDFQALAMAHGVPFAWASNASELRDLLNRAGTGIIGVRTNRTQNVVDHNDLYDAVSQALAK